MTNYKCGVCEKIHQKNQTVIECTVCYTNGLVREGFIKRSDVLNKIAELSGTRNMEKSKTWCKEIVGTAPHRDKDTFEMICAYQLAALINLLEGRAKIGNN